MAITVNTKVYESDVAVSPNQVPYVGPANTLSIKDRLDLYRTNPKATNTFSGVGRSRLKLVRTLPLTGAKTPSSDAIADVNISIPVGASSTDIDTLITDVAGLLALAFAKALAKNLDITH